MVFRYVFYNVFNCMQENKYSRLPFELTFLRSEKKRLLDRILAGISHARNFFSEPLCNATAQFGTNFSITAFLCFMGMGTSARTN